MTEIKDCPFCESINVKVIFHDNNHYAVTCYDCSARGPDVQYWGAREENLRKTLTIDMWNARSRPERDRVMSEFLAENERRRIEHIDCFCDACMIIRQDVFMNRINMRLLNAIDNK